MSFRRTGTASPSHCEELAEFQALGFAAGEGVEGLAELEVAEADLHKRGEDVDDLLVALRVGGRRPIGVSVELDGFGDGEFEDAVDGFAAVEEFQRGRFVAPTLAVWAGDVEIRKELHLDLFVTVPGATVAAAFAGVEGEKTRLEAGGFRGIRLAEKLADGIKGTEKNGGRGARGAGYGGLIHQLDSAEILGS